MNILIGTIGRILNSAHKEHLVRVDDDRANTGGFLIYQRWENSDGPNLGGWFDDWVESGDALSQFFTEAQWTIEWDGHAQTCEQ